MSIYTQFFRRNRPIPVLNELQLIRQAKLAYPELGYAELSTRRLSQITKEHGTDFATALFYDRLCRSREHGGFIRRLEAIKPDLVSLPKLSGKLLVAPAVGYCEYPELGGDGQLIREIAVEFGLVAELLPVLSTGAVTANAEIISQVLATEEDASIILVSLSKGGAEVRLALETNQSLARKIRIWIQIGGLIRGSPLMNSMLNGRWWQRILLNAYLAHVRVRPKVLAELRHGPDSLLGHPVCIPTEVQVINIIGCPLAYHMVGNRRIQYQYLAAFGPNDGSTLLRDAILEPGLVYPIWGADHYFRFSEVSLVIYRLLLFLAQCDKHFKKNN